MITPKIFRAYDIRGVFEKDFDLIGAENIGKGYGTYLLQTSSNPERPLRVCVGRDGRTHSPDVQTAFIAGLQSTGIQVTNIGLAFSPLLFFAICHGKFDGGVNITASHNPKEYNGFKLQREHAQAICGEEIQEILEIIEEKKFIVSEEIFDTEIQDFWESYLHKVLSISKNKRQTKIIIDAGNGVTGAFAPALFKRLGYEVVELFCAVDGNFPNHQPDPEDKKNMEDLRQKVLETGAHYGLAFDGDGDRVGLVDENGVIYDADYLLILLAKDLLSRHPNTPIVYTVTSSGLVKDEILRGEGIPIESKVGHSFVEEKMHETGALLGGESSGHLFFGENYYGFDDGLLGGVKILEILTEAKKPTAEHFSHLAKVFTSSEYKFEVADEQKFQLVERVKNRLTASFACNTIDGVKVDFGNGAWTICRASNTSPKVSMRAEARSEEKLLEITAFMENIMRAEIQAL